MRLSYQNFIVQAKADDVDRFVVDIAKTSAEGMVRMHDDCCWYNLYLQPNSSKPLMISITAAVLPWMPKAAARLPPWCKTIAASPIGMIVAASINQPSGCADP